MLGRLRRRRSVRTDVLIEVVDMLGDMTVKQFELAHSDMDRYDEHAYALSVLIRAREKVERLI